MARTLLTAPTAFYCNSSGGSLGNDGLSPGTPLPTVQDVIARIQQQYDLGYLWGHTVNIANNTSDPGFRISGQLPGQAGMAGLIVRSSTTLGDSNCASIRPTGAMACVALDSGAACSVAELNLDCLDQAHHGFQQDCIQIGQGSHLSLYGSNRLIQYSLAVNGMSIGSGCSVEIQPQSWGSAIQNGGHLHWQGDFQCGIQTDQGGCIEANCNGAHALIAFWMEGNPVNPPGPYWNVAFIDVAAGVALLSGVDFHGSATGKRFRRRKGGTLDLNVSEGDLGQLAAIPGDGYEYAAVVPPGVTLITAPLTSVPQPFNGLGFLI